MEAFIVQYRDVVICREVRLQLQYVLIHSVRIEKSLDGHVASFGIQDLTSVDICRQWCFG